MSHVLMGSRECLKAGAKNSATTTKQLLLDGMYYYAIIIIINSSGSQKINTTFKYPLLPHIIIIIKNLETD